MDSSAASDEARPIPFHVCEIGRIIMAITVILCCMTTSKDRRCATLWESVIATARIGCIGHWDGKEM